MDARSVTTALQMNRPAKLGELFLDIGEGIFKRRAAVRARCPLGQDAFPLQLESLSLPLAIGGLSGISRGGWLWSSGLRLLFFHGFTLPSTRHVIILRRCP